MKRGSASDACNKRTDSVNPNQEDTNVVFQDPYIDQYEEEEIVDGNNESNEMAEEEMQNEEKEAQPEAFRIGKDKLEEGEQLEIDNSAYKMYHRLNVEWPCLSFDVVADNLGSNRTRYPHTVYTVAGTQAENTIDNHIVVSKMYSMYKTQYDDDPEEAEPENYEEDAKISFDTIPHQGAVNRIRCLPDRSQIVSAWSDQGVVSIYNVSPQLAALESGHSAADQENATRPLFQFRGHKTEGYAMDWSRCDKGALATGDCNGQVFVYHPTESGWSVDTTPFVGHRASVEDIQWSPSESTVFATCSVDRTIKIWDTRSKGHKSMLSVTAHASDVNVISWNRQVGYLLVSGSDDGTFRVWDFRNNLWGRGSSET